MPMKYVDPNGEVKNIKSIKYITEYELPSEYQETTYIESTGTQIIDTGVSGNNDNLEIRVKYQWTELESGKYRYVFGSYASDSANTTRLLQYGTSMTLVSINCQGANGNTVVYPVRSTSVIYNDIVNFNRYISNTNNYPMVSPPIRGTANNFTIGIFGRVGGTVSAKLKIYSFDIYDNGKIIRKFIPCYRKADGVTGVYDLINQKFYSNMLGGTNFLHGEDITQPHYNIQTVQAIYHSDYAGNITKVL